MTTSDPTAGNEEGSTRRFPLPALVAASAALAFLVHRFWFVTDDAFISFRYAENWADGLGLRYNLGVNPPVEGFSNFLWTALMAGVHLAGVSMEAFAPILSCLLGFLLLVLVARFLVTRVGRGAVPGLFFVALFPPFAVWCTGGLETMLFALLLFVAFERLLGDPDRAHGLAGGAAAALLVLTRPEGIIWALALCGLLAAMRLSRGDRIFDKAIGTAFALVLAVAAAGIWVRFAIFEKLLPNTAYAKVDLSGSILERGLFYLLDFSLTFVTPVLLFAAIPFVIGSRTASGPRAAARSAAVVLCGFALFTVFAGGDFMAMGRFLAPATPFFAIILAVAWQRFARAAPGPSFLLLPLAALLAIQILPAFDSDLLPASVHDALRFRRQQKSGIRSEYGQWRSMDENSRNWAAAGRKLRDHASEGDSIVCPNIGAIGYFSGLFVFDSCGLVDPDVASRALPAGAPLGSAGHDRMVPPTFFLDRNPTFLVTRVVKDHEVPLAVRSLKRTGLPRHYKITSLPLDEADGALPRTVLLLVERRKDGRRDERRKNTDAGG